MSNYTTFCCRIAGLDYGDREIEYLIDGPRDEHRLPIQELLSRLVTDVGTGLTTPQVQANLQLYGPNAIADSLQVPEWVRFCKCMFGGSTLVLWGGMLLSFTYYSINAGLVSTAQCRNFRIFMSYRFYVKPTLDNLKVLKLPFFCNFMGSKFCWIGRGFKCFKMAGFRLP